MMYSGTHTHTRDRHNTPTITYGDPYVAPMRVGYHLITTHSHTCVNNYYIYTKIMCKTTQQLSLHVLQINLDDSTNIFTCTPKLTQITSKMNTNCYKYDQNTMLQCLIHDTKSCRYSMLRRHNY